MKTIVEKPLKRDNNKDSYMYKNKNDNHFKTNKYIYGCDFNLGRYFYLFIIYPIYEKLIYLI